MKKNTLLAGRGFIVLNLLFSCAEQNSVVQKVHSILPTKEIHYNFETGQKVGEKTLTYNSQGLLILEYYTDLTLAQSYKEIKYEYDTDGNLVKKKTRNPNASDPYYINLFTYENGLKKSEASAFDNDLCCYRTLYFYSGSLVDSTQMYVYNTYDKKYNYMSTVFYKFDALNRVILAYGKTGSTVYRYEADKLTETCNLNVGYAGTEFETCIKNEYDNEGNLIKTLSTYPWMEQLQEELFYKNNILDERKVYTYPGYEPGNTVDIRLIKYEY